MRVVGFVDQPSRRGFAYGTRYGHPVSGAEAFIVHQDKTGGVWLTIRSVTMPAPGWRTAGFRIFLFRSEHSAADTCGPLQVDAQ